MSDHTPTYGIFSTFYVETGCGLFVIEGRTADQVLEDVIDEAEGGLSALHYVNVYDEEDLLVASAEAPPG